MNFYTMGMPLVGDGTSGARSRSASRYSPYGMERPLAPKKPRCQAKTLKPTSSLIDGAAGEDYVQCSGSAIKDDILCTIHRRMTDLSAKQFGDRQGNGTSIVKVPVDAFKKSKFQLGFIENASRGVGKDTPLPSDNMVELWSDMYMQAVLQRLVKS